jgi:hypothetical protein
MRNCFNMLDCGINQEFHTDAPSLFLALCVDLQVLQLLVGFFFSHLFLKKDTVKSKSRRGKRAVISL